MSSSRLYVLTLLAAARADARRHRMRLAAHRSRLDIWTDVRPGALFGRARRLAARGRT